MVVDGSETLGSLANTGGNALDVISVLRFVAGIISFMYGCATLQLGTADPERYLQLLPAIWRVTRTPVHRKMESPDGVILLSP